MTKEELINLAKELASLDDLKDRGADLRVLKNEKKKFNSDGESFADTEMNEEFYKYYDIIAEKAKDLNASVYDDKKALVEKAKALLEEKNMKKATAEMNEIFNQFKTIGRCTKEQDDELWAEMKATRDEFSKKRHEFYDSLKENAAKNKAGKEEIIVRSKDILNVENLKEATEQFNALMEEWKKFGFTGSKEQDDALWNEFNGIRKEINAKRKSYFESMQATYNERIAKKEELIKKAKVVLANSEFTKEEVESIKALRAEWKTAGFAGKNKDEELWNEFNGTINQYFENMRSNKD